MSEIPRDLALKFSTSKLIDFSNSLSQLVVIPELGINPILEQIQEAIKLSVDSIIYLFHTYDSITENNGGNSEGISIYKRVKNEVEKISNEDDLPEIEEVIEILKKLSINIVITGNIEDDFLGIERKYTHDNNDEGEKDTSCYDVITNDPLEDWEIQELQEAGIEVLFVNNLKE